MDEAGNSADRIHQVTTMIGSCSMTAHAYVTLGRSGLRVSPYTLGAMTFGDDHGWGASPAESASILAAYLDRGGNSIDTANIYTGGHSEKIIGDWFAAHPERRERVVLGTKFFGNLYPGDPNGGGAGRKGIVQQLENSLRRLQTDYVDLYWLHNFDPVTPIEETLRALDDLVTAGKVRYVGLSDLPAWKVAESATIAQFRGWAPVTAVQLEYSLLERTSEGELIPAAQSLGLGVLPWGPLRSGFLSGKYVSGRPAPADSARAGQPDIFGQPSERDYQVIDMLRQIAAEHEVSPAAIALAWVRERPGISSVIIGARRVDQLVANLAALDVTLTDGQRQRLDEGSAPELAFPAAANRSAGLLAFGGTTVDGQTWDQHPVLATATSRY
jgi:aryl-alcohol dehydrogenase-like predicted oxidoreductase